MMRKHRRDLYKRNVELRMLEDNIDREKDESKREELRAYERRLKEVNNREKFNYGI